MTHSNILILGGGIVGLATAYNLTQRFPQKTITILEKEAGLAFHQTGRNSGVLHTGIYYKPGSLKALNCHRGKQLMEQFCTQHNIPFKRVGKVIVATSDSERPILQKLFERGQKNGVNCSIINKPQLLEIEPYVSGVAAIHVPEAGIVNYTTVTKKMAQLVQAANGQIVFGAQVVDIIERADGVTAVTQTADFTADYLINCTGLYSDKITRMSAGTTPAKIVPFRGEYFELTPDAHHLCNGLIYPVPDPSFPFLGVHFTRMIEGGVECGPNAVLAFAREGYFKHNINLPELFETLTYRGFQKLAAKYWRTGFGEMWRSFSKTAFVKALQKLVPDIQAEHLVSAPAGVRAQALRPDGSLIDDFEFQESPRIVNVVNAPSPAATSSISVGEAVMKKLAKRF